MRLLVAQSKGIIKFMPFFYSITITLNKMKAITKENKARTDGQKRCTQCKEVKPKTIKHFYRNRGSWDGYNAYCNTCRVKLYIEPEKIKIYQKQWYALNRERLSIERKAAYRAMVLARYEK